MYMDPWLTSVVQVHSGAAVLREGECNTEIKYEIYILKKKQLKFQKPILYNMCGGGVT